MSRSFYSPNKHAHRLQVIVPSLDRQGDRLPRVTRTTVLRKVKQLVAAWAGGYTVGFDHGGWVTDAGQIMEEPVTVVEGYGKAMVPLGLLNELVELIMLQLDQEAVAVINDGVLLLYERPFVEAPGETDVA